MEFVNFVSMEKVLFEIIKKQCINQTYEPMLKTDVRYRFVTVEVLLENQ